MRKRVTKSVISLALAALMIICLMPITTIKAEAKSGIDEFVTRCYKVAFEREPDPEGFKYWKDEINEKRRTGVDVVYCMIFSPEYEKQDTSDEQFVNDLYTMFMGRVGEKDGYEFWLNCLKEGKTRKQVFAGFANSEEFFNLCSGYGITAGYYTDEISLEQLSKINLFVARMYETTLGRLGDQGGQNYWAQGLISGELTGSELANYFICSPEYVNKKLSDDDYVENLYSAVMGRESDNSGKASWVKALENNELTREEVLEGFAASTEFAGICEDYNIEKGDYKAPEPAHNILKKTITTKTNANGTIETDEICNYNKKGLKIDAENMYYRYTYKYNEDDMMTEERIFDKEGNLISSYQQIVQANGDYKTISESADNPDGGSVCIYKSNELGVTVKEFNYSLDEKTLYYWQENLFDENAYFIGYVIYDEKNNETFRSERKVEETYVDGMKHQKETDKIYIDGEYDRDEIIEWVYDANDNLLEFYENGCLKYRYIYDERGNEIKSYYYDPSEDRELIYEYKYDSENRMIYSCYYENGQKGSSYDYEYDTYGNVIKTTAYYDDMYDYTAVTENIYW